MQKNSIKASILIWAIFLSLIISITFIQISLKINKNLRNNQNIINDLIYENQIKNMINSGSINRSFSEQILENGDKIIYDKANEKEISLYKDGFHLSKINSNSNITINILNGGPITYKNNSNTGLVINNKNFSANSGDLIINNLGGYTKINISSSTNDNSLSNYTNYKIIKKIGNKEFVKTKGKIKNF